MIPTAFFVFDVESIGLHGEGFAVAGGVFFGDGTTAETDFCFACDPSKASGADDDRAWVAANVPELIAMCDSPEEVRRCFWTQWEMAKLLFPGIVMAAECLWPVEANFVEACIKDDPVKRNWEGPYPFHEIASYMAAAGMDPMATYDRLPDETPAHHPLHDARQSARLLGLALEKLKAGGA